MTNIKHQIDMMDSPMDMVGMFLVREESIDYKHK